MRLEENKTVFRILIIILLISCNTGKKKIENKHDSSFYVKGSLIKTPASTGISENYLGNAFDKDLISLNSKAFEKSEIITVDEAQYDAEFSIVDNSTSLAANANFLGLVKANINTNNKQRYAILSIYHIAKTITINPLSRIKDNSDLFMKKIYYGWSINYIFTGSSSSFNADVKMDLNKIFSSLPKAGLESQLNKFKLDTKLKLVGLKSQTTQPPMILNPEEVQNYFQVSDKIYPIFVEYEVAHDFQPEPIKFVSPMISSGKYKLQTVSIEVSGLKPNGLSWDIGDSYPDPYIKLLINGNVIAISDKKQDKLIATYELNKVIDINEGDRIEIIAIDADFSDDDFIGGAWISYSDLEKKKINKEIELQTSDGLLNAKILINALDDIDK